LEIRSLLFLENRKSPLKQALGTNGVFSLKKNTKCKMPTILKWWNAKYQIFQGHV